VGVAELTFVGMLFNQRLGRRTISKVLPAVKRLHVSESVLEWAVMGTKAQKVRYVHSRIKRQEGHDVQVIFH
jgi:hypothetical protein